MRILIIEDDINLANSLKSNLESEYFMVDISIDGESGTKLALLNEYDLVILDNILPGKEGAQICREVRNSGKSFPILVLSAIPKTSAKIELLNSGADDYLTKPFSFEELLARINALLRRPKQIENETVEIGDLNIDIKNQTVKRKKKELYLTRKEFALLKYLAKNRGAVATRAMILEHVWDAEADPFSNTIESHILSLRKKIGCERNKRVISTIPGRGYKILS